MPQLLLCLITLLHTGGADAAIDDPAMFAHRSSPDIARRIGLAVGIEQTPAFAERARIAMLQVIAGTPGDAPPHARVSAAIYHVARMGIHARLETVRPEDRWLLEALAYAVTEAVFREVVGEEAAAAFLARHDPAAFADLRTGANLAFWRGGTEDLVLPLPAERRMRAARISFALNEGRRLLEEHDLSTVAAVLDRAQDGTPLLDAAAEVTGRDVRRRAASYQAFETTKQGLERYGDLLRTARADGRRDEAVMLAKRIVELRRRHTPRDVALLALLLHEAGRTDAGLHVLQTRAAKARADARRLAYLNLMLNYGYQWKRTVASQAAAEHILEIDPDHAGALAARMRRQFDAGKLNQARVTAWKIIDHPTAPTEQVEAAEQIVDHVDENVGLGK